MEGTQQRSPEDRLEQDLEVQPWLQELVVQSHWSWPLNNAERFLRKKGPFDTFPEDPTLHPGAFGARRRFDIHAGVDLYCNTFDEVRAVEDGVVVTIEDFTGPKAGFPWWFDTQAVLVEGGSGVVLYGEIDPAVRKNDKLIRGDLVGKVLRVLKKDKGRPMDMLHLELHVQGTRESVVWNLNQPRPEHLCNPTPFLKRALFESYSP